MLHAQIHLVPYGLDEVRSTLTDVYVCNDGTGDSGLGNYDVYVEDPRGKPKPRNQREGWVGRIEKFPRQRDQAHATALIAQAMMLVAATRGSGPAHELASAAERLGGGDAI